MSYENRTFKKAAEDAGIKGRDWRGNKAINDFSTYYHNTWRKWEREKDGYKGVLKKARRWWSQNKRRYS